MTQNVANPDFVTEALQNFSDIPCILMRYNGIRIEIDDYAKDNGPGEVRLLYSFYHEPLHTRIKRKVNKFAI